MRYRGTLNKWISIIHRKFQIYLNKELEPYNINSSEFIYIMHLSRCENTNLKVLSDHLFVDGAGTTRVIKNLVKKGLVEKIKNQDDKREYSLTLTSEGKELVPKIRIVLDAWLDIITKDEDINKLVQMEKDIKEMALRADKYVREEYKNDDKNDTLCQKV